MSRTFGRAVLSRAGRREQGSASVWVLACCGLLLLIGASAMLRANAVLARHRAESAADLAALAAAGQIGVSDRLCAAARSIAAANAVSVARCIPDLALDGRSGSVRVQVVLTVHLPVVGARTVRASARAGRDQAEPVG